MYSPLVLLSVLAGVTALGLGWFALRNRDEPGAPSFGVFMLGVAIWSLSYGVALTVFNSPTRELFEVPMELGKALVAPAWLTFALGYTGRSNLVTRRFVAALSVVPLVTLVLVATNDIHHLLWSNYRVVPTFGAATVGFDAGIWYYAHAGYGYLLIGTGVAFIGDMILSLGALYREQALAMLVGSAVPTVTHVKRTLDIGPFAEVNFTPIALAFTGLTFAYALFRFELFGLAPSTRRLGRRAAIDDVGVGVLIINPEGRIVEANREATSLFGVSADSLTERNLESVVPGFSFDTLHSSTSPDDSTTQTVTGIGSDTHVYELTTTAITDQHDRLVGHTVALHDVTEREHRRQRLEVLNRILRHNLRNDMTVVLGYAQTLAETLPESEARMARIIERNADHLVDLGEKAQTLERLVTSTQHPRRVELAPFLTDICNDVCNDAASTDVGVDIDVSNVLTVDTDADTFAVVISNLVENAVEHADSDAPWVAVSARESSDAVVVTVADDGPGIPPHELAALDAGTETPLQHGSGLGLWLVHWGVMLLGATLSFESRDPRGTMVEIRLTR